MEATADDISARLNRIYNVKGYLDKYGLDVWLAILLILVFSIAVMYFSIKNKLEPIKSDWINQKCNPAVIPFAGWINAPVGTSSLDYTAQNFTGCVQQMLIYVANGFMAPIYYALNNVNVLFKALVSAMAGIRALFNHIRNIMQSVTQELFGRLINLTVPLISIQVKIQSVFSQVIGALTGTLMVIVGSFLTFKSFLANIVNILIYVLLIMVGVIIGLWILSVIPIINIVAIPALLAAVVTFVMIAVITIILSIMMTQVLGMSSPSVPTCPTGCFAPDTPVDVFDATAKPISTKPISTKPISTVQVGDRLADGALVTGTIVYTAATQALYEVPGGVHVTAKHRMYVPEQGGWIHAEDHREGRLVTDYASQNVYCLLTESKVFSAGGQVFSDWDDMDDDVRLKLMRHCPQLPATFDGTSDVHRYLDGGFLGSTKVHLFEDDASKALADVQVGDILREGAVVLGTVKVWASDIPVVTYGAPGITGSRNLWFKKNCSTTTANLGDRDVWTLGLTTAAAESYTVYDQPVLILYHLLTSTGSFTVADGLEVGDYNTGLDKYLQKN